MSHDDQATPPPRGRRTIVVVASVVATALLLGSIALLVRGWLAERRETVSTITVEAAGGDRMRVRYQGRHGVGADIVIRATPIIESVTCPDGPCEILEPGEPERLEQAWIDRTLEMEEVTREAIVTAPPGERFPLRVTVGYDFGGNVVMDAKVRWEASVERPGEPAQVETIIGD